MKRQASWGSECGMRVDAGWKELEAAELLQGSALVLTPSGSSLWSSRQKLCSELLAGLAMEFKPGDRRSLPVSLRETLSSASKACVP